MSETARILAFSGSTREASWNRKLLRVAVAGAEGAGASVTVVDLRDLPMPFYDGDLEAKEGLPANARKLRALVMSHHGLLIGTPEYNFGLSGVLKNAIDWVSRKDGNEAPYAAFKGRIAAIVSSSPGATGGARALLHLRTVLTGCKALVIAEQLSLGVANKAFEADGKLTPPELHAEAMGVGAALARTITKLNA